MKTILLFLLLSINADAATYFNNRIINQTNPAGAMNSAVLDLANYAEYSIQIIATATVACTAAIYASNDNVSNTMILVSGTSSAFTNTGLLYTIKGGYRYVQLQLTGCAGAGSLKAYVTAKEI